jgi:xanthine dehydrogenase YagS FAD-binding subunit
MKAFTYSRLMSVEAAVAAAEETHGVKFLGGGTNLVDLMREEIEQPDALVDITGLPFSEIAARADGGVSIGAGARNTAVAAHPAIRTRTPCSTRRSSAARPPRAETWQRSAAT